MSGVVVTFGEVMGRLDLPDHGKLGGTGNYGTGDALRFAMPALCLCRNIRGDFNCSKKEEVEFLTKGNTHGRVER